MLQDAILKYTDWPKEKGATKMYNCAEAMLNAANDYYSLGLDEKALRAIAPFGGGFFMENSCGLVTGGLATIGVMFASEDHPYANPKLIETTKHWVTAFEDKFGTCGCKELKEGREGCKELASDAAALFETVVGSPV